MSPQLKGINTYVRRAPDGKVIATYFYAWKGGPRLPGKPGSREFVAAYEEAHRQAKARGGDDLASLALRYQASPEFAGLAEGTRKEWRRFISLICADEGNLDIGGLPIGALDDPRVKGELLAWRDQWQHTKRKADFAMQVLSRVLSFGRQRGLLATNAAIGLGRLYDGNRAEQIWTPQDIAAFVSASTSPEISFVPQLACLTGLRLHDLHTLTWDEVGEAAIVKPTRKSNYTKVAVVPLLDETKELLARIKAQQLTRHEELIRAAAAVGGPEPALPRTVLSHTLGRGWRYAGLSTRVSDTKKASRPPVTKHLHDARGTFATRLRLAGLTAPEIADVLGWDEERVERLLSVYVDRQTVVMGIAERIQRLEAEARIARVRQSNELQGFIVGAGAPVDAISKYLSNHGGSDSHPPSRRMSHAEKRELPTVCEKVTASNPEHSRMKYPLIGLCAMIGGKAVERRSPWVSDDWLGAEIARDPWLFREVEFEFGYFDLPSDADPVRWPIPASTAEEMGRQLRASYL